MKKLLLVLSIFMGTGISAANIQVEEKFQINSERVSPCRYWRSTSAGYTCSSYAFVIDVPDARDVELKFRQLEARIQRLEDQLSSQTVK